MNVIEDLTRLNIVSVFVGLFIILFAGKEIIEIFTYFKKKFRIRTGLEQDHETVEQRITTLEKHDNWQYGEIIKISKGIDKINTRLVNKEISDIRWEILDFASSLSSGRKFSKEQFDHVISTHQKYEQILAENGMSNGLVTSSMEVIIEKYKECLKSGFH